MSTLLIVLGFASIAAALIIVHNNIENVTIGENACRLVAIICVAIGYSFFSEKLSQLLPLSINVGGMVRISVIIILVAVAGMYVYKVIKNWEKEVNTILRKSSFWLTVAVALLVIARFLLAAGLK